MRKEDSNKSNNGNEFRKSPNMQEIGKEKNEIEIKWSGKKNCNVIDTRYKEERARWKPRRRKIKKRRR